MADDTTEDDLDAESQAVEIDDCAVPIDYVLQRTNAFLTLVVNYNSAPEELKPDIKAFMGVVTRSIRTYNDKGEVSKLRSIKTT